MSDLLRRAALALLLTSLFMTVVLTLAIVVLVIAGAQPSPVLIALDGGCAVLVMVAFVVLVVRLPHAC